jgi:hypothetical protein
VTQIFVLYHVTNGYPFRVRGEKGGQDAEGGEGDSWSKAGSSVMACFSLVLLALTNKFFHCRFVDQVNTTLALLHPINCTRERKMQMVFDVTTIPAFLIVLGCLYMVLRPRRPKPKIN